MEHLNESWLCNGESYQFHGDFILDNIIINNSEFTLLDWRQDFGGDLEKGDIYYDLAKLNHNLIFNHDLINKNHYLIEIKIMEIKCEIITQSYF